MDEFVIETYDAIGEKWITYYINFFGHDKETLEEKARTFSRTSTLPYRLVKKIQTKEVIKTFSGGKEVLGEK